jgi:hypothetical protein
MLSYQELNSLSVPFLPSPFLFNWSFHNSLQSSGSCPILTFAAYPIPVTFRHSPAHFLSVSAGIIRSIPSTGLWQLYIDITITVLATIHSPVFYSKHEVSETEFCLRLQVETAHFSPADWASLSPDQNPVSETSCFISKKWRGMKSNIVIIICSVPLSRMPALFYLSIRLE